MRKVTIPYMLAMFIIMILIIILTQERLKIENIEVPEGYQIKKIADIKGLKHIAMTSNGIIYALSDRLYILDASLQLTETDHVFEEPNGLAAIGDTIYVADGRMVLKIKNSTDSEVFESPDEILCILGHYQEGLFIGTGDEIIRISDYNGEKRIQSYATGIDNIGGMAIHPLTKDLWFSDGRELNRADAIGHNFSVCTDCKKPEYLIPADASDILFYDHTEMPLKDKLLIAEAKGHITNSTGYQISALSVRQSRIIKYQNLIVGWTGRKGKPLGIPSDLLVKEDGSLLIVDTKQGTIFQLTYENT